MKKQFIKIVSITLAFLVLFSTFSFTVEKHYCGDFLVDVSFTGDTEACGMEMDNTSITTIKTCCKDELHKIEGQDELQTEKVKKITFESKKYLTAYIISFKKLFLRNTSKNNFYKDFSPPDSPINYQVLYQTFLI